MAFEQELQACEANSDPLSEAHYREINPYRGLEFFDSEHAPFFRGRTRTVGELLDVLQQQMADKKRFVLVLGPAGSGKTSLVRAGILPVLTQTGITERDTSWRLALARPADGGSGDPFEALALALLKELALPEFLDAASQNGWRNLAAELREAPENAALRLRETLQYLSVRASDHFPDERGFQVPPADPDESVELPRPNKDGRADSKVQLALVVDQLEELFVGGFSPELQQRYIAALGALVKWRVAFVIAVLQSEFYASFQKCCIPQHLAVRPEFRVRNIDLLEVLTGRFDFQPPGPREIKDMICLPAEATGLRFELDPETGRSLDAALWDAATAHPEPLPLLEHVLWQLYRKQLPRKDGLLRWSDYRELGEFEGALANHADSVFSTLGGEAQAALKSVIQQLVRLGPGEHGVLIRRTVPYRDLVSISKFGECGKTVAEEVIDRFIQEGFFHAEKTGPNAEVLVSITQECLLRKWPRVRQLLNEDLGLLRTRDQLEPNFKLWLSGGRKSYDLLRNRSGIHEAKALLRNFRASLSATQVEYLQRSLRAKNRHRWVWSAAVLAAVAGLLAPVLISGIHWLSADSERRKVEQPSGPGGKIAQSAVAKRGSFEVEQSQPDNAAQAPRGNTASPASERDALQARLSSSEANGQQIQKSLELVTRQRDALQGQLNDTEAKAQQAQKDAALATNQRDALQNQLKDSEAKAQQAQKDTALATNQRDALQNQLKDSEAKARQAQKDAALATNQRDALQNQLKDSEAKAQQAQKDAALATSQRDALQSQLKVLTQKNAELPADQRDGLQSQLRDAEARAQQIQKSLELAISQRETLQNQLKDTEAKAQQAQKDAALGTSQREALQGQLKDAETRAQQAQKDAALATNQRDALQNQLKDSEANAQQAQKDVKLVAGQRDALQGQLKDSEVKAQQGQRNLELVTTQRDALENQLKELTQKNAELPADQRALQTHLRDAELRTQQIQGSLELVTSQRETLQNQLKETEAKAQQAQKNVELVTSQRDALQSQLNELAEKNNELPADQRDALQSRVNDAEARAQQIQKNLELATSQRNALQNQLKDTEAKAQQAQKDAALGTSQRDALQNQLKDTEAKAQQAQKNVELVTSQRDALQNQLKEKDSEAKTQQAQKNAALAASQRDGLQTQLKDSEAKAQETQKDAASVVGQRDGFREQLAGLSTEAQQAEKDRTIGSADATGPISIKADPMQKNEPTRQDQEPAKMARINQSQAAVPLPAPSGAVSLESTPEAQTGGSSKASTEEPSLKEFVLEYIRTVASNDASTQTRFFEPRVNYYGERLISRSRIQASMERYRREWPVRNWEPKGDPEFPKTLHSTNPKLYEVLQPLTWTVSNGLQHKQGSTTLYFRIWKNDKGEFHIVHIEQRNPYSQSQNN